MADAALRIVLDVAEVDAMVEMRQRVAQMQAELHEMRSKVEIAEQACPVLQAVDGDCFELFCDEGGGVLHQVQPDWYIYRGLTKASGRPPKATPPNWLAFQFVVGDRPDYIHRRTIGIFPQRVYDDDGQTVHKTICVPPEHARYFRKVSFDDEDDLSSDGETDDDTLNDVD